MSVGFQENFTVFLLGVVGLAIPVFVYTSRRFEYSVVSASLAMLSVLLYASELSPPPLWRMSVIMVCLSPLLCLALSLFHAVSSRSVFPVVPLVLTGVIHLISVGVAVSVGAVSILVATPIAFGSVYLLLANVAVAVLRGLLRIRYS